MGRRADVLLGTGGCTVFDAMDITRRGLSRAAVERAAELAAEMCCSASTMLAKAVAMVREIELCEAEAD